ncbi:hypothetical protein [Glutamicibacter sp. NPDC087583]|uniref:hypothetical protein n=1 Tax=Glutamicibacter sp. NPDC087583 TaxID=3363995 RepID=UPI00380528DB
MALPSFARQVVQVHRKATVIERGTPQASGPETTHEVTGCWSEPRATAGGVNQAATWDWLLLLPPGSDITEGDLVTLPSIPRRFRLDAPPIPHFGISGVAAHVEAHLVREGH